MPADTLNTLTYFTAAVWLLAFLMVGWAYRAFRRSRNETYWRQRRDAGRRGLRLSLIAVGLMLLGAAGCMITGAVMLVEGDNDNSNSPEIAAANSPNTARQTETVTPTLTPSLAPTLALSPTPVLANTLPPQASPTPTASLAPTQTPFPTAPIPTTDATLQPSAQLDIIAIDDDISADWQPMGETLTSPVQRIYVYIRYSDVTPGVLWQKALYHDGVLVGQQSHLWGNMGETGETFFFFGHSDGFAPGQYEVRVTLGGEVVAASAQFTIPGQ